MQVTELVCPVAPENLPAVQSGQTVEAVPGRYPPFIHVPAAYLPAVHSVQTVEAVPAAFLPASQFSHAVAPADALYLPAVQSVQTVEPVPAAYLPADSQLSHAVAPADALNLPASHSWHTFVLAPTAREYLPALQFSQASDPDVVLNLPAMQNEQSPSGPVKPALH